jgi:hypothetical protein
MLAHPHHRPSVRTTNDFRNPQDRAWSIRQVLECPDLSVEILGQLAGIGDLQDEAACIRFQPEILIDGTGQLMGRSAKPPVTPRQLLRLVSG